MPRRVLEGKVTSDKMDKTVTVSVERRFMHPKYKKYIKKSTKYAAHDESNSVKAGETVQIIECAPISKRKTWTVVKDGAAAPSREEKAANKKSAPKAKAEPKAEAKKAPAKKAAPKKTTAKKAPAKKAAAKKSAKKTTKKTEDKK
jgi:small subunit ribosomal protein S17